MALPPEGNDNYAAGSWLAQIKHEFELRNTRRRSFRNVSIYRVPKFMKTSMEEVYAPQVVALGPYNRTINPQLSAMDEHKIDAVYRTLGRMSGVTLNDLIAKIQNLERAIRDCYEESIQWEGETFAWMFTLDACFILEFLRTNFDLQRSDPDYASLVFQDYDHFNLLKRVILTDILKLENQIPLFIISSIIELEYRDSEEAASVLSKIILTALQGLPPFNGCSLELDAVKKDAFHLLDVKRSIINAFLTDSTLESPKAGNVSSGNLRPLPRICNTTNSIKLRAWIKVSPWFRRRMQIDNPYDEICAPSAESLQNFGVKFRPAIDGNVRFERHTWSRRSHLFLPVISVTTTSEIYLRNLLAFEECHKCISPSGCVISSVMMLMDCLINTEKDVAILREAGILQCGVLGDSDEGVAIRFNTICRGVTLEPVDDVLELIQELREYYYSPINRLVSQFKEEYFSKPWYIISLVAATLALVMTALQTYYSAKTYYDGFK